MLKYKRDTHHSIICCPLTHTSFFMVFSLSSASSIRLASMKSLYLSVITMKWNISVRSFPHADNRQKNNCFRNNLFFFCNSNYPVSALLSYHSLFISIMIHASLDNKQMNGRTISKNRLGQLSEEGFEQAADYVQVLPSLWRHKRWGFTVSTAVL